jgi:hypothetical protein
LRRRFDTIARPARVRMRSRKPCTRARRRLFGWNVRLPFATTLSSLHLASCSGPGRFAGGTRLPSRSLGRLCVSLVTGAGPAHIVRIAAVSPTFGRLDEGTDECSPGQTWPSRSPTRPRYLTNAALAIAGREQFYERPVQCCRTCWRGRRKLLASDRCSSKPYRLGTAPDNEARMADRLPGQMTHTGCLERRSRVPSAAFCGAMAAVLSTLVDNHVDSSWSRLRPIRRRQTRGSRR